MKNSIYVLMGLVNFFLGGWVDVSAIPRIGSLITLDETSISNSQQVRLAGHCWSF